MTRLGCLGVALLLVAVASCNRGDDSPETTAARELRKLLDADLGEGMRVVDSATGPMTTPLAAKATAVRAATLEPWLETHGFQGGYSRVWTSGGTPLTTEVLTSLVYHFFSERNAVDFVAFSLGRVATSAAYTPFHDPAVPGSAVFTLTSRVAKETKFCASEYFPLRRDAYLITRCAPYPVPTHAVTGLAGQQLAHAITAVAS